ncbi:hypothetical protein [Phenylobacterium sp.]|uniref:hypothetical protein n=1 Tax=Phenylobacterium sp. TaxID=1871053 RepID=UPI00272F5E60|nr:hypothetical protein [Phenylobacterium sp.]MDP1618781.1 hypothetical protein [Phenylobacterium sp.]MDP1989049.1 hypothetical protein [Phenylobacterium sp.]
MQALFHGITVAAATGLLLGASFKPDLTYDEAMLGPQIHLPAAGDRADWPEPQAYASAQAGQVPDYVIGYDWTHRDDPAVVAVDYGPAPLAEPAYEPVVYIEPVRQHRPMNVARVEPPRAEIIVSYPSIDGNIAPRRMTEAPEPASAVFADETAPVRPTHVAFAPSE